jgi:protein-disulfide isomerase
LASKTKFFTICAVAFTLTIPTPAKAADSFTAEQKAEIEQIIHQYMLENGELVLKSVEAFREAEEEAQNAKSEEVIQENLAALTSADAPSVGNPNADVTVIEFFDYNCGYCKRAVPDIQALVKDDPNVRFVFREMPILGPTSVTAAKWAVAAHNQGKYFDYHAAIMEHRGAKTDEELAKLAGEIGLDVDKMKADANAQETQDHIDTDLALSRSIGINGTPAFIIDGKLYPGYIGKDGLKSAIETARQNSDKKDG